MEQPLGHAVGNWCEVEEAVATLRGAKIPDLIELVEALGAMMVVVGGKAETIEQAVREIRRALWSGRAYEKFLEVIRLQGGDGAALAKARAMPSELLSAEVSASRDGCVQAFETRAIGEIAASLGAGRRRIDDPVDPLAGIIITRKRGESVARGEVLATLFSRHADALREGCAALERAITIGRESVPSQPLISTIVDRDGVRQWVSPAVLP
jgi:pyrimidine-nucleoside phosphorylase